MRSTFHETCGMSRAKALTSSKQICLPFFVVKCFVSTSTSAYAHAYGRKDGGSEWSVISQPGDADKQS